jgi:hypothetical protein
MYSQSSLEVISMKSVSIALCLLAAWPFGGRKYHMTVDPSIPSARGDVEVKHDSNGNTQLDIKVFNLANPARLTPPANIYMVWVRPTPSDVQKEGALKVDKNLKGELKTSTTAKDCDVLITAEQSESVSAPSGIELLRAHISPR